MQNGEAVVVGAFGLVGVFITTLGQILLSLLNRKQAKDNHTEVTRQITDVEGKADAAYCEANGANAKLLAVKEEIHAVHEMQCRNFAPKLDIEASG
jgi:hypothetical protein